MTFGQKLDQLITAQGTSQAKVARETGLSQSAISNMIKGERRPYMDQAAALARSFGVSLDFLANDELEMPPTDPRRTEEEVSILRLCRVLNLTADEAMRRLAGSNYVRIGKSFVKRSDISHINGTNDLEWPFEAFVIGIKDPIRISSADTKQFFQDLGLVIEDKIVSVIDLNTGLPTPLPFEEPPSYMPWDGHENPKGRSAVDRFKRPGDAYRHHRDSILRGNIRAFDGSELSEEEKQEWLANLDREYGKADPPDRSVSLPTKDD